MKKVTFLFIFVLIQITGLFARNISVGPFEEVILWGNLNVQFVESSEESIVIDRQLSDVDIEVEDGVLSIKRDHPMCLTSYESPAIDVVVNFKQIRRIKAAAGVKTSCRETLTGDHLKLEFKSGANGQFKVAVVSLDVRVVTGAELSLLGTSENQEVNVATGGILAAHRMTNQRVIVKATTGGEADITALESIDAKASTGGIISYEGTPRFVRVKDNLGGEIRER